MSTYDLWKNYYIWGFCTKDTLQLLVELGQLTQDQVNQIIDSKPDLTGRVIEPIPKGNTISTSSFTNNNTLNSQQATAQG